VKVYQDLGKLILEGVEKYNGEVRQAKFPSTGNYYKLEPEVLREWKKLHPDD
jgi:ketopantoate hydroxymethyltransferase